MAAPILFGIVFFFIVCLGAAETIKPTAMAVAIAALLVTAVRFGLLRERLTVPFLALTLYFLMDGISTFYAVSGKFALSEFLKVLLAYCLAVILLGVSRKNEERSGKRAATVLAVCAAIGSLASIDLLSTHIVSGIVLGILDLFTDSYHNLIGVEDGIRMTSLFTNPNTFAGFAGIGVLLSLGLAGDSEKRKERCFYLALLYVNSLAFILAFSMGASAFIALAFLAFLALESGRKRAGILLIMLETLVLVAVSAALVSMTSFNQWSGMQPVPLACALLGAGALCLLDCFLGQRLADRLGAHGKTIVVLIVAVLVLAALFAAAAWNLTGEAALAPGETLRRAAYPDPGTYTLELRAEGTVYVTVESQNRRETMMHTETRLYSGKADEASFTVPEDSLVVYFSFSAPDGARIISASCGAERIPLRYKLLPGFIANRLQGLLANENAIQRLVFFEDGMKLFRRSPVFGLGMGAFENGIKSTQSFYYETKYAHDHYIQTLLETGVVGLLLFLLLLISSAAAVWKSRKEQPYAPMLGAALVFMAGHAVTEIVFSTYAYLPMAFGVFALISLCCGKALKKPALSRTLRSIVLGVSSAFIVVFCVLLGCNMLAARYAESDPTFDTMELGMRIDKFEWADYALPYVISTMGDDVNPYVRQRADACAERLSKVNSNTIPAYLAEYYFRTDRTERAIEMLVKYVDYVSSDPDAWETAFTLLRAYEEDSDVFRSGVVQIAQMLETWNEENMGDIQLDKESREFLAGYL